MRMALLLAGQARSIDKLDSHALSILRFIARNKPDIYCSFWDEPEAAKAIAKFNPKKYILAPESEFIAAKQDFWDRWSAIVSPKDNVEHRRKWYWGEVPDARNRDNTIRHWDRMTKGIRLLEGEYDITVVTRTDIYLKHDPVIFEPDPMKMYSPCRTEGTLMDRFFWGQPATIIKMLTWENLINGMAYAELNGKYGRRPMSLSKGGRWLAPENTMMLVMKYLDIFHVKQPFRTAIIR